MKTSFCAEVRLFFFLGPVFFWAVYFLMKIVWKCQGLGFRVKGSGLKVQGVEVINLWRFASLDSSWIKFMESLGFRV